MCSAGHKAAMWSTDIVEDERDWLKPLVAALAHPSPRTRALGLCSSGVGSRGQAGLCRDLAPADSSGMTVTLTEARFALIENTKRARALIRIFNSGKVKPEEGDKRGRGRPTGDEVPLRHAVVIFSIGALDAYLSDVAAEVLVDQLSKARNPDSSASRVLAAVQREIPTLPFELALATDRSKRLEIAQQAITAHLTSNVSNLESKGVVNTLERIGAKVDWDAISPPATSRLRESPSESCASVLDRWTRVRHQLVHQGGEVDVAAEQAREIIGFIDRIAEHVDQHALAVLNS